MRIIVQRLFISRQKSNKKKRIFSILKF